MFTIKERRIALGMTVTDLAKKTRKDRGFISQVENGALRLDRVMRISFSIALKCKPEDFICVNSQRQGSVDDTMKRLQNKTP